MKKNQLSLSKLLNMLAMMILGAITATVATSCDDSKSYAELLADENKAVNWYLSDQRVIDHVPADSVFEVGEDAPFYCIDTENSVYMQVLEIGNGEKATTAQKIYFRYRRAPLNTYNGVIYDDEWSGNSDNITADPTYFKYDTYTDEQTLGWGTGIQQPLRFLGLNSHVRLVVKSQYGPTTFMASVTPYLWDIRYFKSQI